MPIPELVRRAAKKLLTRYCRETSRQGDDAPPLAFEIGGDAITLHADRPIARFRYCQELGQWTLHYPDREGRWRFYLGIGPSLDLAKLLRHLDADPMGTFWD